MRGYQASLGPAPKKLNKAPFTKLQGGETVDGKERILDEKAEKVAESVEAWPHSRGVEAGILDDLGFERLYGDEG